jgi:putative heme-binding domain-containing protein
LISPSLRVFVVILSPVLRRLRPTLLAIPVLITVPAALDHSGQYPQTDVAAGARVYAALCIGCHGPTGAGIGGIDLRHGPLPRASTDAALTMLLGKGIPGTGMPSFTLDAHDARALIAFIRSGFDANTTTVPQGDPARGRAIFEGKANCLTCHRLETRGRDIGPDLTEIGRTRTAAAIQRSLIDPAGSMIPINRPVRAETRDGRVLAGRRLNEDTYTVQIITEDGRLASLVKSELRQWSVSTTSPMPSYKDTLAPGELLDVVAYVASLKGSSQ